MPTNARVLGRFGPLTQITLLYILENFVVHLRPPEIRSCFAECFVGAQMLGQR